MPLSQLLPRDRWLRLLPELARFGVVGAAGYATDVVLFNLLRAGAGAGPLSAKAVSLTAATAVAYAGNRWWTYRERTVGRAAAAPVYREFTLFVLVSIGGLLIQLCCLAVSHYLLGFTGLLADNISGSVVGMAGATVFRLIGYRTWVFRAAPVPEAATPDATGSAAAVPGPAAHDRVDQAAV
ncbi:GtrA family protein [Streptacidiphilus jiangxiensis]|uniref:Putative flippase GtrA (Transmembrane translocase of bactoprenol-linked glucose) n=1 Tax=Streptacidiphilus jiangxiensis TaxID=235985 RepID=A0A1H7NB98_STRJI|nr:GtrA family protein [Streptacidiphilus jiangxiensis]SEL20559.1 Putative flippase GtrA (transmembrane translocase of bactoprenol-linked glucose) [Streptacidiphilus jiangxiensis]